MWNFLAVAARILSFIRGMMMRRLTLLSIAAAASFGIAACEQSVTPTIAGLGGQVGTDTSRGGGPTTSSLVIIPSTLQLGVGATFQFGTNAPLSQRSQVEWNSLDPNVVAISPTGQATAIAPGVGTITARFSFDTAHVAVATVNVTGVAVGSRGTGGM
jgi:hypothetical protein